MDPVAIAIFAFIAITAVAFLFYALQGESEDSFEKHAKESTKLLLADTTKEKKQTGKGNKGKQKKDKKEKKDDGKLEDDSHLKEKEQPKPTPTPSSPAKKPVKEEKKETKEQTNKQTAQSSKTKREVKEVKDESSDKENKEHVTEKKIAPEASTPAQSQNTVVKTGQGNKNTKKDKKKETLTHEEAPKKKNRGPPPTDLDQHKVLGRLADIEEIEPEYISFLAQFFHDTCEKETHLVTNMSLLEKTNSDMKGKIDQHVLAKMTAERELQLALRSQDQLNRRIAQLEDEIQNDAETINQLKQTVNEHTMNATSAVDDAELQRLRQAEQAQTALQNTVQSLHNELQNARQQIDALSHDLCRTRVTADLVSEMTSSIAEKDKLLVARGNEIEQLHNEFNDLELLVREMKAEMNRKDEVIIQSSSDDKLQLLRDQLEDAQKELEDREYTWHQRESDLMIEQKRLNALVDELHREIAKFEQFKEEQRALQAKLVEKEKELEQKQKLITDQEIFVSREEALKAENASLKSQLDQLRAEHEEFKAANQQKSAELLQQLNDAKASAEEVVVLKKSEGLNAAPTSSAEVEELKKENKYLHEKNEELRQRNFKILDDVTTLEKKVACGGGGKATSSTAATSNETLVDAAKQVEQERVLVASALGSIGNLPALPTGADSKKYSSWLKDVSSTIQQRVTAAEQKAVSIPPTVASAEETAHLRSALVTLSAELSRIERAWGDQTCKYEKIIEGLNKKLNKTQISSLRESITTSPVVSPPTPSVDQAKQPQPHTNGVKSADEEEWEVVN